MKEESTKSRLFQYAVIFNPTEKELKEGTKVPTIVVEPTTILAKSEQEVLIKASRMIPETYMSILNQVDIVVRPF